MLIKKEKDPVTGITWYVDDDIKGTVAYVWDGTDPFQKKEKRKTLFSTQDKEK